MNPTEHQQIDEKFNEKEALDEIQASREVDLYVEKVRKAMDHLARTHDWSPEQRAKAASDFLGADVRNFLIEDTMKDLKGGVA